MPVLDLIPKKKQAPIAPAPPSITVPRYTPQSIPSQHPVPPQLARKLADLGRRFVRVNGSQHISRYVSVAVLLLSLQMFLDWLVDMPLLVRTVILAADIGLLVFFVRRQLLPLILHPPSQETCALMAEKHWPLFHGRMIAAVQLAQPRFTPDSPELVHAVQQETESMAAGLDFREIVPAKSLKRRAGLDDPHRARFPRPARTGLPVAGQGPAQNRGYLPERQ
jgi:hypothetical protein